MAALRGGEMLRKVQVTGGATYIISLPKSWARNVGLKPGDLVQLIPQPDASLLLIPKKSLERKEKALEGLVVASSSKRPEDVIRELISCYLVGYDVIRIKFERSTVGLKPRVKDVMRRKLVGVEIVEETADYLVARCLLGYVEFPVKDALSRMHTIALSMLRDAISALRSADKFLAKEVVERDDEVDRLYFFVIRQLKMAVENRIMIEELGLSSARDCLGYRLVAKSIERMADHAARIGSVVPLVEDSKVKEIVEKIAEISEVSIDVCRSALKSLYQLDAELANQAIAKTSAVVRLEESVTKKILGAKLSTKAIMGLRLILESVRRIAEYGADVAEIAVNLSMRSPREVELSRR